MFGAAAVRKKRKEQQDAAKNKEKTRGPYIKPFGPRFDRNSLPYFKYKVTKPFFTVSTDIYKMF